MDSVMAEAASPAVSGAAASSLTTAAVSVNTTVIHTTYVNTTIVNNTTIINNTHSSFNGGPKVAAKPTAQHQALASQPHLPATAAQQQHETVAKQDKSNFASANHGVPAHAAVPRPATSVAELQKTAVTAKAAPGAKPYVARPAAAAKPAAQPAEAKPAAKPAAPAAKPAEAKPAAKPAAPAAKPVEAKPA